MKVAVPTAWETRATEQQRQSVLDNHRCIALAITNRDADGAREEMDRHFDASIQNLLVSYSAAS